MQAPTSIKKSFEMGSPKQIKDGKSISMSEYSAIWEIEIKTKKNVREGFEGAACATHVSAVALHLQIRQNVTYKCHHL